MDTTQKNREETPRRPREDRPREAPPKQQRPRQQAAPQDAQRRSRPAQPQQEAQRPRQERPKAQSPAREAREAPRQERPKAQPQTREVSRPAEPRGDRPKQAARQDGRSQQAARASQPTGKPRQTQRPRREVPDDLSAKKRAYGNSKPKKKTAIDRMSDVFLKSMERSAARKKAKEEAILHGASRSRKTSSIAIPAVIYTQPQAFNRSRLFVQLLTVTAVVLALVIGLSVFFKVGRIDVIGADVYTAWTVREASGINEGDGLLTFSRARAGALIKANLPYVKNVSFGIKLPDTVNIIIEEEDVVYSIQDQSSMWWLINSEGRVVSQTNSAQARNHTQVLGVTIADPVPNERAVAAEQQAVDLPSETTAAADTSDPTAATETQATIPVVGTTGAERLDAALKILGALEDNDIVGEAASVDLARIDDIMLWYGTRYQVKLGDTSQLEYKVACMNDVILQMSDYQSGILDVSFTVWPDRVGYTPFS